MKTFLNCLCSLKKIENVQVSPACTRSTTFFWRTNTSARFSEHAIYVFVDTELSINLFFLMNFNIYLNFLLIPSTAMFICSRPLKWQWSGDEHNVLMICIWNKQSASFCKTRSHCFPLRGNNISCRSVF